MEYAIVALAVSNIMTALACWRFYMSAVDWREACDRQAEYETKLINEIGHYKEEIRMGRSMHAAKAYELEEKLRAAKAALGDNPATFEPGDTQGFQMADILARHE